MDRSRVITLIHVARRDLRLDEDTYKRALRVVSGRDSCRDMTLTQLLQVLEALKKRGFRVRSTPQNRALKPASVTARIRAVWREMHRQGFLASADEAALSRWVKNQTAAQNGGEGVANYQWLHGDPALASQMLERLKRWHRREMLRVLGLGEREPLSHSQTCQRFKARPGH